MSINDPSKQTSITTHIESEAVFVEVGKKLGIALPASLMLLASMTASATIGKQDPLANLDNLAERDKLLSNEVAAQLFDYAKQRVRVASAANCNGIHGDSHVNTNDPNVTNNGKHTNVHTNQHGDSCRY